MSPASKQLLSVHIADVSAFARALGHGLHARHATRPSPPGQVELLNLIARAQGQRNWQAMRQALQHTARSAAPMLPSPASPPVPALSTNARKALAMFDDQGRLVRWPVKFSLQKLVMWPLWTRFAAKRVYTESEVNTILKAANLFSDHATLRRELINHQLMSRASDCSAYRKLPARPDDEARSLLAAWRQEKAQPGHQAPC